MAISAVNYRRSRPAPSLPETLRGGVRRPAHTTSRRVTPWSPWTPTGYQVNNWRVAGTDHVVKVLKQALKAVDESGVPAELRTSAFQEAIRLLSSDFAPTKERAQDDRSDGTGDGDGGGGAADHLRALAKKLAVSHEAIAEIFHDDAGELKLIVASSKLLADKGPATKQIAVLIAAGRQGAGIDAGWTESKVIRETCSEFGKFDSSNFAGTLGSMGDVFSFVGAGQSRKVKVNRPGFERAGALVTELVGAKK